MSALQSPLAWPRIVPFSLLAVAILHPPTPSTHSTAHAQSIPNLSPVADPAIDPAAVQRLGPAWRYPRAGWIVLHIEGKPYERGYQHGKLLAREIERFIPVLARARSNKSPSEGWEALRLLSNALFLRKIHPEFLEEMKGIADGASAAGATYDGRPLDLVDIVAINCEIEATFLDNALDVTPTGLEDRTFDEPRFQTPKPEPESHCSAFVATGPATADGKVVIGHITMWNLLHAKHYNIWLDIQPEQGHRVVMQTYPGSIMSGLDWYMNSAGLVVLETTLEQTGYHPQSTPLCSRIRRAVQYGGSIDEVVAALKDGNNGLYTNEWLIADTRSNEIAMFELGTHKTRLWRSSNNEWFANTPGLYWGCNNAKDLHVRLETTPSLDDRPINPLFLPSDRDLAWLAWFDQHKGKIDAKAGRIAFTTPPLAAFPSLDAKVTTTDMASRLESLATFGPPLGRPWTPTPAESRLYPEIEPLVPNDWVLLSVASPPSTTPHNIQPAVDLAHSTPTPPRPSNHRPSRPAWRGTLLPEAARDAWLAAAFANYQELVAREQAHADPHASKQPESTQLDRFTAISNYLTARARTGEDPALESFEPRLHNRHWNTLGIGKGVLALQSLRSHMGDQPFLAFMNAFGKQHAGQPVSVESFLDAAHRHGGPTPQQARQLWLGPNALNHLDPEVALRWNTRRFWSIHSFEQDIEKTLIVYGSSADVKAQHDAATRLQQALRRRWSNVTVPILADTHCTDADLKGKHLLLVGRPAANLLTARFATALPCRFGPASLEFNGEHYAHPNTAVIAAGPNPLDPAFSLVAFAGLGAEATWLAVDALPRGAPAAELAVSTPGNAFQRRFLPVTTTTPPTARLGAGQE